MTLELDFDKLFKISLLFMKINRAHPDVKKDMKWALQFFFMHGIFTIFFCLLLYSTIMHEIKNRNLTQACANGTIGVLYTVASFQYFTMLWHRDKLKSMIETMKRDYSNAQASPEERVLVMEYAYRGKWVTKLWLFLGTSSAALFPLKSIFTMIYYALKHEVRLVPVYELTYPKSLEEMKNNVIPFIIVFILMLWYAFYASSTFIGLVPMGPIFILHACCQLELAKTRVKKIYPKDGYKHEDTIKNMKLVAKQLQDIYGFVENIKNTFQYSYELYMKGTSVTLPITVYQIIQSFHDGDISLEFVTIVIGCVCITSVPCYYSDLLLTRAEKVGEAIYMSGWEAQWERRERSLTLMLLLRLRRPMAVRSVFRTMSLDALTDMYQQAYTIFNVLNAAWG